MLLRLYRVPSDYSCSVILQTPADIAMAALLPRREQTANTELIRAEMASVFHKQRLKGRIDAAMVTRYLETATNLVDTYYGLEEPQAEVLTESIRLKPEAFRIRYVPHAQADSGRRFMPP